jgi:hypothetical protein
MPRTWMLWIGLLLGVSATVHAQPPAEWRASTPAEQALDTAAFSGVDETIRDQLADVQSAVVVLGGRVVYEYYRDGNSDTLRDVQSIAKSALSALTGIALGQGRIASLDQPVVDLVPEWAALNSDPRAATITVRHLLTMTAGFEVNDPTGTAAAGRPQEMWARPLRSTPGQAFAYDNALIPMLSAVLERATSMPLADYARQQLTTPLALQEPSYRPRLLLRTVDMAKLGQLFLRKGVWDGKQLMPEAYVMAATQPQNARGSAGVPALRLHVVDRAVECGTPHLPGQRLRRSVHLGPSAAGPGGRADVDRVGRKPTTRSGTEVDSGPAVRHRPEARGRHGPLNQADIGASRSVNRSRASARRAPGGTGTGRSPGRPPWKDGNSILYEEGYVVAVPSARLRCHGNQGDAKRMDRQLGDPRAQRRQPRRHIVVEKVQFLPQHGAHIAFIAAAPSFQLAGAQERQHSQFDPDMVRSGRVGHEASQQPRELDLQYLHLRR